LTDYSAIHPDFIARMDSARRAGRAGWDLSYRPWADGRRMRIAVLNRLDNGDYFAAANAQGLDMRDPTADLRLIEYCLAVPDRQYLHNGQTRRLLHRLMGNVLPPKSCRPKARGYRPPTGMKAQAPTWRRCAPRSSACASMTAPLATWTCRPWSARWTTGLRKTGTAMPPARVFG